MPSSQASLVKMRSEWGQWARSIDQCPHVMRDVWTQRHRKGHGGTETETGAPGTTARGHLEPQEPEGQGGVPDTLMWDFWSWEPRALSHPICGTLLEMSCPHSHGPRPGPCCCPDTPRPCPGPHLLVNSHQLGKATFKSRPVSFSGSGKPGGAREGEARRICIPPGSQAWMQGSVGGAHSGLGSAGGPGGHQQACLPQFLLGPLGWRLQECPGRPHAGPPGPQALQERLGVLPLLSRLPGLQAVLGLGRIAPASACEVTWASTPSLRGHRCLS